MDAYEIITEYLKAERDKRKEVESISIDDQHKNIILAGINQKIAFANVIKEDLNKLFKLQNVFEVLKPMMKIYTMYNPYEGSEDYILSVLDTTTHLTRKQYIIIKELVL